MKLSHDEKAAQKRKVNFNKIWFKKSLELMKKKGVEFESAADIGAGKGEFLLTLRKQYGENKEYLAIDYSTNNINELSGQGLNAIQLDLENINLERFKDYKNKFDCIVCLEVIEHIFNLDPLFEFFNFLLKKNGKLIISTPNMASSQAKLFYWFRGYPVNEGHHIRFITKRKLERFGFFNGFSRIAFNNYFTFDSSLFQRMLGIKNKVLAKVAMVLMMWHYFVFSKIGIFDGLSNNGLVCLFEKVTDKTLGTEVESFQNKYEKLDSSGQNEWLQMIKRYYRKDKLKDTIYFRDYIQKKIKSAKN